MKLIAWILLSLLSFPSVSFADPGVGFTADSAALLKADLDYCDTVEQDRDLCDKELTQLKTKADALAIDLGVVIKAKDDYKRLYTQTNEALQKEQAAKPSRWTWFGAGFVSAIVVSVVGALAVR